MDVCGSQNINKAICGSNFDFCEPQTVLRLILELQNAFEGNYDPHIWFDVGLWSKTIGTVTETLIEMDPPNSPVYKNNSEAYLKQLSELDQYVQQRADSLPKDKRVPS